MFKSVKSNKISEYIIEQIWNAIFEGRLKPGDKLPPEKTLMETFHVSKANLREAIRSLEILGFLEIPKGVSGGAFVTEVDMKKENKGCLLTSEETIHSERVIHTVPHLKGAGLKSLCSLPPTDNSNNAQRLYARED